MSVLLEDLQDGVLWLTLHRPERRNALNPELREALLSALQTAENREEVRVIAITGAGEAFCAGGDLKVMQELVAREADFREFLPFLAVGEAIVRHLRSSRKPTLAVINGATAGAGLGLAMACDLRIASEEAFFLAPFVRLGLHPDWGLSHFLPRRIGAGRALWMTWTAERVDARTAYQWGLVEEVCPHEELRERAQTRARQLAQWDPELLRAIRESLEYGFQASLPETILRERTLQRARWESADAKRRIREGGRAPTIEKVESNEEGNSS